VSGTQQETRHGMLRRGFENFGDLLNSQPRIALQQPGRVCERDIYRSNGLCCGAQRLFPFL